MKKRMLIEIICGLLVLLLLYTGISKLVHPKTLEHDMYNQPFPHWMATIFIWTVPEIEILISIGLLLNKTRTLALWAALVLMSLFSLYTAAILLNLFPRVPCSCGGVIRLLTWKGHLALNLFYVTITTVAIMITGKSRKELPVKQIVYS